MSLYVCTDPSQDRRELNPVVVEADCGAMAISKVRLGQVGRQRSVPSRWKRGLGRLSYRVQQDDGGFKTMWAYGPF